MKTPRVAIFVFCLYLLAAVFGEAAFLRARLRDATPEYNRVRLELRYLPTARSTSFSSDPTIWAAVSPSV